MKANVFTAISLLVMMVFAGCQTIEDETSLTSTKGRHTITIHATKDDPSRTIVHEDDANTFHTAWEVGDRIAICEMVKGISTDPDLFEIDDLSGFVSSNELRMVARLQPSTQPSRTTIGKTPSPPQSLLPIRLNIAM